MTTHGLPEMYEPMIRGLEASGTRITADAVKSKFLQGVKMSSVVTSSSCDGAFFSQPNKSKSKEKTSVKCFKTLTTLPELTKTVIDAAVDFIQTVGRHASSGKG